MEISGLNKLNKILSKKKLNYLWFPLPQMMSLVKRRSRCCSAVRSLNWFLLTIPRRRCLWVFRFISRRQQRMQIKFSIFNCSESNQFSSSPRTVCLLMIPTATASFIRPLIGAHSIWQRECCRDCGQPRISHKKRWSWWQTKQTWPGVEPSLPKVSGNWIKRKSMDN